MTDIATLGIRVDSRQLAQGTKALDQLGDQAVMTETQIVRSGAKMSASMAQTSRAMRLLGVNAQQAQQGMRMLPFQLNQMAQMGQVTGNWMQAVSIQLPDILQGFGTMRLVMAGTAVGLAASLIPSLIRATGILGNLERDTRSTTERVDDLSNAFKNLQQAQDLAASSTEGLIERYGVVSAEILRIVEGLERAALTGFQIATREAVAGFQELESEVGRALGMLQTIEAVGGNRVRGLAATFDTLPGPVREAAAAVQNFATSGQEELAVQRDRALQAAEALQSLNDPAYNEAISNLLGFADVASQALGRIRDEAGATAGALSALGGASGPDAAIAGIRESGTGLGAPLTGVVSTWRTPDRPSRGGNSGASEITAEMRAADQAIRQAQEAAVQFGDVQAILNERLASGAINLETYNAALEQARERYSQVGEATEFWNQQQQALKDGILDAIVNGEDLADTFQNIARSIARAALEAALFGSGPLAGGGGGSGLLGGLFSGLFGRASGGPVTAGQPYVVGERRPELFVPSTSGRIEPTVPGGGSGVTVQVNNYSGQQVETTERKGPDGQRLIEVSVGRAISEGRFDRAMASRYGNTPQRVRR
jgi:hypothetical protein